jgi:glycosyltransferase involved in cell wall biosynthesis
MERCERIGCTVETSSVKRFAPAEGVPVISFCNSQFWGVIRRLDLQRNPMIWVPCMNYLTDREVRRYNTGHVPAAIVCQSEYQQSRIQPELAEHGVPAERIVRIRGAFDPSRVPYSPKKPDGEFVVGRVSRPDPAKFRPDLWEVLGHARDRIDRPLRAKVLGWKPGLAKTFGKPPEWAEVYAPGEVNALEFMRSLDVLYQSGHTAENWPRVGLEAMATGLPIVADDKGGWREMTEEGRLAALVDDSTEDAVDALVRLAEENVGHATYHDCLKHEGAEAIRTRLCSTPELWGQWEQLFQSVTEARHESRP